MIWFLRKKNQNYNSIRELIDSTHYLIYAINKFHSCISQLYFSVYNNMIIARYESNEFNFNLSQIKSIIFLLAMSVENGVYLSVRI